MEQPHGEKKSTGHRWGMVIDLDKCSGCGACEVACMVENNIPFVEKGDYQRSRSISWMKVVPETEGTFPEVRTKFMPQPCMQCDNPPCTKVCPVHATYLNPEGIVAQVYWRCIGCRLCMAACPYTVKYFNWHNFQQAQPAAMTQYANPDVSLRDKGVVEKCTFCHHRLMKVKDQARLENREIRPGEYTVACQDNCPSKAIFFGDLNDPHSEVARLADNLRAFRLMDELGTQPKVIYLAERKRHD
ncbi:MAG: 4Fe-4S dicluster domain-containing protein [Deltaproteobacteria bacterium]|nr:4Fe-4S dicluster domain-containing protein [Deltaproteobacteria bacterium]